MKIELMNYSKKLKNDYVLSDINLSFESGKVYGFCGGNGSGKTMLLRAICGLIRPTNGQVKHDDKVLEAGKFPNDVGLMIGHTTMMEEFSGLRNLEILNEIEKKCSKEELIKLLEKVLLDPKDSRPVRKYSMGMNQKLTIAQAVMGSPKLILLDEPTNSLDEEAVEAMRKIIKEEKEKGNLIIMASHSKEDIWELCDEIITLKLGKIIKSEKNDRI